MESNLTPEQQRALRARLGLTQRELGGRLGIEGNTVARQERGAIRVTLMQELLLRSLFPAETRDLSSGTA